MIVLFIIAQFILILIDTTLECGEWMEQSDRLFGGNNLILKTCIYDGNSIGVTPTNITQSTQYLR